MEKLKQLEKTLQEINIEIGAFAILQKEKKPSIHPKEYYLNLLTAREYLKHAVKYLNECQKVIYTELMGEKFQ